MYKFININYPKFAYDQASIIPTDYTLELYRRKIHKNANTQQNITRLL